MNSLPGTPQHQALLRAITTHYKQDRRVQALILFGSLVRGDWDAWSDLDLDVIFAAGAPVNLLQELDALRVPVASVGEKVVLILPDGPQEGDVVLESLMRFSVRYHTLEETSPNIVDSMLLLAGSLDITDIQTAGMANHRPAPSTRVRPAHGFWSSTPPATSSPMLMPSFPRSIRDRAGLSTTPR